MDSEGSSSGLPGSDNQDSNEPTPPGTVVSFKTTPPSLPRKLLPSSKGVENAKKRLRAFSIQKKTPIATAPLVKPSSSAGGTGTTVLIGKLSSVKPPVAKVVEDESKKLPKPPKPGANRKNFQDSYTELQKRTLAEIEDMKRKMELVDLGIPLGLICPSSTNEQAMPTKAMPPIKTFLDASKVDEIIRDAKKAKAEGKKFKFDYQKILPDYDNPSSVKQETTPRRKKKMAQKKNRRTSRRALPNLTESLSVEVGILRGKVTDTIAPGGILADMIDLEKAIETSIKINQLIRVKKGNLRKILKNQLQVQILLSNKTLRRQMLISAITWSVTVGHWTMKTNRALMLMTNLRQLLKKKTNPKRLKKPLKI
ncbi:uncharacterized protein LOC125237386 [Leguminivora glycinivorella]|uniref:uncharacterized protein LOC125237386 n=1 Tax=Leguminivora glycinivorella TaxID=1035111 RepID=UPI00200F42B0|nr:uncharacterized protein LOC125237386 [Leguminivora glycinivorella]